MLNFVCWDILFLLYINVYTASSIECISTECASDCGSTLNYDYYDEEDSQEYVNCLLNGYNIQQEKTVFIGDSNIDYWRGQIAGLSSGEVITPSYNFGFAGDTCKGIAKYAQTVLDQTNPSTVVLHCGENDFYEWDTPQEVYDNLIELWNILRNHESVGHVYYIGTMHEPELSNSESSNHRAYDELVRNGVAAEEDATSFTFVDVYTIMESAGNGNGLYASDNLHLSPFGYKLWGKALRDSMNTITSCSDSTLSCESCTCARASSGDYTYELSDVDVQGCESACEIMAGSHFVYRPSNSKCRIPLFGETDCVEGRVDRDQDWNIYDLTCSDSQPVVTDAPTETTVAPTEAQYVVPDFGLLDSMVRMLTRDYTNARLVAAGQRAAALLQAKDEEDNSKLAPLYDPAVKGHLQKIRRFFKNDESTYSEAVFNKQRTQYNKIAEIVGRDLGDW